MSIDYNAVIARGFIIPEFDYDSYPAEFSDEWVIDFNSWSGGPYLIGYSIKTCEEGEPVELNCQMGDAKWDHLLLEACRSAGIKPRPIKTYFGVRVN